MLTETGKVIAVDRDRALVETVRRSVCGSCAVNKACGTGVIAKVMGRQRFQVEALNPVGARVGEEVVIGIEDRVLVRSSLLAYALPLALMLVGGVLGEWLRGGALEGIGAGEGLTIVLAGAGLAAGFFLAARLVGGRRRGTPVILERAVTGERGIGGEVAGFRPRSPMS